MIGGESNNGKEKQGWQDDGGKGARSEVRWRKGSRQEPSSGKADNADLAPETGCGEGRTTATWSSIHSAPCSKDI